MNKRLKSIQLTTFTVSMGLKGTTQEIEPFYKAVKSICTSLEGIDMQGSIRVLCESSDVQATKRWEMKLICPPLPTFHRIHVSLEALCLAFMKDKRVTSVGQSCVQSQF